MKVSITYRPNDMLHGYPYTSNDVYVPDEWTDDEIRKWYEFRHGNINHVGIKVESITHA